MPLIERRYAEALVGISSERETLEEYQNELHSIVDIYDNQFEFRLFLLNPEIRTDTKKKFLQETFEGRINDKLLNFLMLLLDKDRVKLLPGILDEFTRLVDRQRNILSIKIISAIPLEKAQVMDIEEKYKAMYGAGAVKSITQTDMELIGGVKVIIGDKVYDRTIKGRLASLKELVAGV